MMEIWTKDDKGWKLSPPEGFEDEATLHGLIEKKPEMLQLSGKPTLFILGREVSLGSGYADLVAVETSGRPVIVEVKLAKNNEARRAVVAQILAYAANLHGMSHEQLADVLPKDGLEAVREDAPDAQEFTDSLDEHLREGRFRLVFVLDEVPQELMTLVAYLEHVTDKLLIDLVEVNSFEIGGTSIVLPQRVTPERHEVTVENTRNQSSTSPYRDGSGIFKDSIRRAPEGTHADLHRLLEWADNLEQRGLVRLRTAIGKNNKRFTLRPELVDQGVGLLTLWNDNGAAIQLTRSVFERNAPSFIERIEELTKTTMGQGNTVGEFNDELLLALTEAYEHAANAQSG